MALRPALALVIAATVLATGCGGSARSTADPAGQPTGTLTVLAAASLTESLGRIDQDFRTVHPRVSVQLSFAGSSTLVAQVTAGAPADVIATASSDTMAPLATAGKLAGPPVVFATNVLEIAVSPGNPAHVAGLADLSRPGVTVAVCAAQVPCGAAAGDTFARAGVAVRPVTYESDVKAVLAKVRLGEVDAGVVYRTDVIAAGSAVAGVVIPSEQNATTEYPAAVLRDAPNPGAARAFVAALTKPAAQALLRTAGFGPP